MRVFDFDGTLYRGDSTLDFYLFCLSQQPHLIAWIPFQSCQMLGAIFGRQGRTAVKEGFYSFLRHLCSIEELVEGFWQRREGKLNCCLVGRIEEGDVVVSASPDFLLRPLCDARGWELIASQVDPQTGVCLSPNCRGGEKVRRFRERFPRQEVSEFYSDSRSDAALASLADRSFLVRGSKLLPFVY